MSNVPLPRPGPLGLIQYAGVDMQEYAAAVSAAKDAKISRLKHRIALHDPCNGRMAGEPPRYTPECVVLRAEVAGLQIKADLFDLAVRKGLLSVHSELIDPRNHGTRVSWMQGHDKACDISNDAAAHGIAASPAAPAAPVVPLTDERITKALRRAFSLGQTYWQQADSDSYTQNAKSDETRQKFETLIVETLNGITGGSK